MRKWMGCFFLCLGCSALWGDGAEQVSARASADARPLELPASWRELSPIAFEHWAAAELDGAPRKLSARDADELASALDELGSTGVRAAVILGGSRTRAAAERLLAHLERRVLREEGHADAADVVAAHALLGFPDAPQMAERLEALGSGAEPHPDLEVRVECAASALALGRTGGITFLLRVLLIGTPAGQDGAVDFQPSERTAWARGRAAQALAERAGIENPYRADAPLDERVEAVRTLREALPH